jgi:hypothetical protein
VTPSSKPQPDGTFLKALAWAWRWQRMLDEGVYSFVSGIRDAENISKSYVSRILRLALLAPKIVDEILAGSTDQALVLERLERPLPASWEEQQWACARRFPSDRRTSRECGAQSGEAGGKLGLRFARSEAIPS